MGLHILDRYESSRLRILASRRRSHMRMGQSSRLSFSINAQSIDTAVLKPMRLYRTLGDGADPLAAPQKSTGSVTRISELWAYFWGPFLEIGQSWRTWRALPVSTSVLPANFLLWESSVSRPRPPGDPHLACRTQASSVGLHRKPYRQASILIVAFSPRLCSPCAIWSVRIIDAR